MAHCHIATLGLMPPQLHELLPGAQAQLLAGGRVPSSHTQEGSMQPLAALPLQLHKALPPPKGRAGRVGKGHLSCCCQLVLTGCQSGAEATVPLPEGTLLQPEVGEAGALGLPLALQLLEPEESGSMCSHMHHSTQQQLACQQGDVFSLFTGPPRQHSIMQPGIPCTGSGPAAACQ